MIKNNKSKMLKLLATASICSVAALQPVRERQRACDVGDLQSQLDSLKALVGKQSARIGHLETKVKYLEDNNHLETTRVERAETRDVAYRDVEYAFAREAYAEAEPVYEVCAMQNVHARKAYAERQNGGRFKRIERAEMRNRRVEHAVAESEARAEMIDCERKLSFRNTELRETELRARLAAAESHVKAAREKEMSARERCTPRDCDRRRGAEEHCEARAEMSDEMRAAIAEMRACERRGGYTNLKEEGTQ